MALSNHISKSWIYLGTSDACKTTSALFDNTSTIATLTHDTDIARPWRTEGRGKESTKFLTGLLTFRLIDAITSLCS